MPLSTAIFSSAREDWETPTELFNKLNSEFKFSLDAAASPENYKLKPYLTKSDNALVQDWCALSNRGAVWLNPPYSRKVGLWISKACSEAAKGCTVVCLVAARTSNKWFHDFCWQRSEVELRFLKGRLRFGGAPHTAPFPSMLVIFRPRL